MQVVPVPVGALLIPLLPFVFQEPQEPVQVEKVPQELTHEEQMQAQLAQQLQLPSLAATGTGMASAAPPPAALGAQVCRGRL